LKALPSKPVVIAAGRRKDRLDQLSKDHGLETIQADVNVDTAGLKSFVDDTLKRFPNVRCIILSGLTAITDTLPVQLDAVLFASGIQYRFNFAEAEKIDASDVVAEINVNFTSIVAMTTLLLPHFLKLHVCCLSISSPFLKNS
jgi:short-subunit dehydrogenase involved in D-alanine esterification of teichoic acids